MKYFEEIKDLLEKYAFFPVDDTKYYVGIEIKPFDLDPIFAIVIYYYKRMKVYTGEFISYLFKTKKIPLREFYKYHRKAAEMRFSFIIMQTVRDIKERFFFSKFKAEEDSIVYASMLKSYKNIGDIKNDIEFARKFLEEFIEKFGKETFHKV